MSTITALEPQQRRKGRTNVYADGRFLIGVSDEVIIRLKLRVGQLLDEARLRDVSAAEDLQRATDTALHFLETRPRTQHEIEARLARDAYGEDVIARVVEKLTAMRLLNDAQFAAQWIEAKTRPTTGRPSGRRRLTTDLYRKGIDKETIEEAVSKIDDEDELILARAALNKKIKILPTDPEELLAEKRRLSGFLARRGFGWSTISQALREVMVTEDE